MPVTTQRNSAGCPGATLSCGGSTAAVGAAAVPAAVRPGVGGGSGLTGAPPCTVVLAPGSGKRGGWHGAVGAVGCAVEPRHAAGGGQSVDHPHTVSDPPRGLTRSVPFHELHGAIKHLSLRGGCKRVRGSGECAHHPSLWAPKVPIAPVSRWWSFPSLWHLGGESAHCPSIWAPSKPITLVSRWQECPSPWVLSLPITPSLGSESVHCQGVWAPSVPTTSVPGHQVGPSPSNWAARVPINLSSGSQLCPPPQYQRSECGHPHGIWARSVPITLGSECQACPSPWCQGSPWT